MSYRIDYAKTARNDMRSVMRYIKVKLKNDKAASDLYDEVQRILNRLRDDPEMFPVSDNPGLERIGVRKINIRGYNMFYLFTGDRIYIVRFVSTLMDQYSEKFTNSVTNEL